MIFLFMYTNTLLRNYFINYNQLNYKFYFQKKKKNNIFLKFIN